MNTSGEGFFQAVKGLDEFAAGEPDVETHESGALRTEHSSAVESQMCLTFK